MGFTLALGGAVAFSALLPGELNGQSHQTAAASEMVQEVLCCLEQPPSKNPGQACPLP